MKNVISFGVHSSVISDEAMAQIMTELKLTLPVFVTAVVEHVVKVNGYNFSVHDLQLYLGASTDYEKTA
jgi:hypothetical protein